ncbi:MAG: hypothetical protein RJQ09_06670 [Cyclobacteriaceae bacterium]
MIRFLNRYKLEVSSFLLSAFLIAVGWSILCDLEVVSTIDHHDHTEASTGSHSDHGHHHDVENEGHNSGDQEDPCCEDLSDNLFSSIAKHNPATYSFINNALYSSLFTEFKHSIQQVSQRINRIIIQNDLPPPKIPDIRIFIQSFLN